MDLHLFGAATPTGESFRHLTIDSSLFTNTIAYSRAPRELNTSFDSISFLDLNDPSSFSSFTFDNPSIIVSFSPIWLFAPFFKHLCNTKPEILTHLRGLVVCSSSSVITKRFSFNHFDRHLFKSLSNAENQLSNICLRFSIPLRILRPTMIYGKVGIYSDNNISRLISILRRLPVIPLPANTGLRQPIHASQLASVSYHMATQLSSHSSSPIYECLTLGGDTTCLIFNSYNVTIRFTPVRPCYPLPLSFYTEPLIFPILLFYIHIFPKIL